LNSCLAEISGELLPLKCTSVEDLVKSARKVIVNLNKLRAFKREPLLRARKSDPVPQFQAKKPFQSNTWHSQRNSNQSSSSSAQTNNKPETKSEDDANRTESEPCKYCKELGHSLSSCKKLKAKERRKAQQGNANNGASTSKN
jgi:hypothetical protein